MKILLVNYEYKPQCGGAGLGTYNLAYSLNKMGHEVSIIVGWDYKFGNPEIIPGVNTYIIKLKKKNIHQSTAVGLLKFVIKGIAEIRKITTAKQFDIIQFYFSVPTGILKFGIKGNIPYVVSLRGMDIPGFRNDKYRFISNITRGINRNVINDATAVTSLSKEAGDIFLRFMPGASVTIIPNSVDYEQYVQKTDYKKEIRRFVAVSRLTGFKKLDLMIEAFSRIHEKYPQVTLDIYGEGKDRIMLESQIEKLKAQDYVKLKGYANRQKLIELLPRYDVFSLMSIGDSFGIVFIEAMSCGLPILCARAGGPVDIVRHGESGILVEPDNIEDTIRGIEYCINHADKMEAFGREGRKMVEEKYSRESIAMHHIELYSKILKEDKETLFAK